VPATECKDDEAEEIGVIEGIVEDKEKSVTTTIIMGDWNSEVGEKSYRNTVGVHRHRRRNQRGQTLIDFCE
jgi:endonuclease/exonuclease/phosphatase family metal-dependent hydrolase